MDRSLAVTPLLIGDPLLSDDLRQVIFDPAVRARLGQAADALRTLRVREIMTWGVVTVRPESAIRDTAWLMREQRVGALPVVEHAAWTGSSPSATSCAPSGTCWRATRRPIPTTGH